MKKESPIKIKLSDPVFLILTYQSITKSSKIERYRNKNIRKKFLFSSSLYKNCEKYIKDEKPKRHVDSMKDTFYGSARISVHPISAPRVRF